MYSHIFTTFKLALYALSTFWLIRLMWGINIVTIIALIILDACHFLFPFSPWIIILVQFALLICIYFITLFTGSWNLRNHRIEVDPMISLLLLALLYLVGLAHYRSILEGETGIKPYIAPVCIAIAMLIATSISYLLGRKNERLSH